MNILECKIESCTKPVRIKKLGLCQMHETRQRHYGDPNYKSQRKSFIPLKIPGGEVIWNYQKAKKITTIISNIEKMIMCGYIDNWNSFGKEIFKQIGRSRVSKKWFYDKYIEPILETKMCYTILQFAEDISILVEQIMKDGKASNDSALRLLNLGSFGIKREENEYSFIDTDKDLGDKVGKLKINLDTQEPFETCYMLKTHYNRYKKLTNKD